MSGLGLNESAEGMSLSSESTTASLVALTADHEEAEPLEHHSLLRLLLGLSLTIALHRVGDAWLLCVRDVASRPVALQVLRLRRQKPLCFFGQACIPSANGFKLAPGMRTVGIFIGSCRSGSDWGRLSFVDMLAAYVPEETKGVLRWH